MNNLGIQKTEGADSGLTAFSPFLASTPSSEPAWNLRFTELYEAAKRQQWSTTTDLEWTTSDQRDLPLADESYFARASFATSPLARYGTEVWEKFRSEFQTWVISQFVPGEHAAMMAAARVLEAIPYPEARFCLASQINDEARHAEVFSRYIRGRIEDPYPASPSLTKMLHDILNDSRWDVTVLGMHIMVEALAMAALRLADRTFHDSLLRQICRLVARDEVRHVSLGIMALQPLYAEMPEIQLRERREFVLEALNLVSRRFLFEEIWERLGIESNDGIAFARTNDLMNKYRQAICNRVVYGLARIGLVNAELRDRLSQLNLLGASGARLVISRR